MANEMIGAEHTDCQVINGRRVVYVAAEAEAVRVTVRRDGRSRSAKVEIIAPEGWVPTVLEAVRVDGSAESGHVGAVLTFPGGERVTIGAPAEALRASALCVDPAANEREEIRAVREILSYPGEDGIGRTVESMARHVMDRWKRAEERALAAERRASELESFRERAPAASASAREEPAPPAARWWQTVGAWGTREGRDTAGVVLVAPEGAWMRYPNGAQQWMTAATLDGMTPIPAPPPPPPQPPPVEPIKYVLKVDGVATSEAISSAFERAMGVRLPAVAAPEPGDAPSAEDRAQMAENAAAFRDGSWKYDLTRCPSDVLRLLSALAAAERKRDALAAELAAEIGRERDHYYGLLEASTRTATELHAQVCRLRGVLRDVQAEAARHAARLRASLASLESTFRNWAESERNGAWEAFRDGAHGKEDRLRAGSDAWTKAAEEVARVRKAAP